MTGLHLRATQYFSSLQVTWIVAFVQRRGLSCVNSKPVSQSVSLSYYCWKLLSRCTCLYM